MKVIVPLGAKKSKNNLQTYKLLTTRKHRFRAILRSIYGALTEHCVVSVMFLSMFFFRLVPYFFPKASQTALRFSLNMRGVCCIIHSPLNVRIYTLSCSFILPFSVANGYIKFAFAIICYLLSVLNCPSFVHCTYLNCT